MVKLNITKEDLEMMNYNDIAYVILENTNKKKKIKDLFLDVCDILELDEEKYQDHITDFFALLSTDKRFIMLDDGYWDLKDKHNKGLILDDDRDEDEDDEDDTLDNLEDDLIDEEFLSDDDSEDDDLKDLVIIEDEEDL